MSNSNNSDSDPKDQTIVISTTGSTAITAGPTWIPITLDPGTFNIVAPTQNSNGTFSVPINGTTNSNGTFSVPVNGNTIGTTAFTISVGTAVPNTVTNVKTVSKKDSRDGCDCKKCKNFFPLAEANQADGTLICWACRHNW